jgi:hypothetical protein
VLSWRSAQTCTASLAPRRDEARDAGVISMAILNNPGVFEPNPSTVWQNQEHLYEMGSGRHEGLLGFSSLTISAWTISNSSDLGPDQVTTAPVPTLMQYLLHRGNEPRLALGTGCHWTGQKRFMANSTAATMEPACSASTSLVGSYILFDMLWLDALLRPTLTDPYRRALI